MAEDVHGAYPHARLVKARAGSFDRLATETAEIMAAERRAGGRLDAVYAILFGVSVVSLAAVGALLALTEGHWLPWLCPAIAAVISFGIVVLRRWRGRD